MTVLCSILIGFLLDGLLGDPHGFPHPVRLMGRFIAFGERRLRAVSCRTPGSRFICGMGLSLAAAGLSLLLPLGLLLLLGRVRPWLRAAAESVMCYQIVAMKSLRTESMKVCGELENGSLEGARKKLSWIVGRDTQQLDRAHVIRAAVETVAENTGDGVVAPTLYLLIGGAPLGFFYKAVNTLDSMIGYRNERYRDFGRFAARMDDVLNWIPARFSGLLMIAAAFFTGMDARNAARIFRRDRRKHASPNSACPESACAGALGIRLGGSATYSGRLVRKPELGDAFRPPEPEDIRRANRLMTVTSLLFLAVGAGIRWLIVRAVQS